MNFAQLRELYEHAPSPAPASIAALEKMVRLQRDALTQAEQDLAAAREKPRPARPARRSHSPSAEEVAEFLARSVPITDRQGAPDQPELPGLPEGGARLSAEQTVEVILRARRRARGEEPLDLPPLSARVLPQMPQEALPTPEETAATAALILRAGAKRRGEIPLDPQKVVAFDQHVHDPKETARFILAAAQKARSKT